MKVDFSYSVDGTYLKLFDKIRFRNLVSLGIVLGCIFDIFKATIFSFSKILPNRVRNFAEKNNINSFLNIFTWKVLKS